MISFSKNIKWENIYIKKEILPEKKNKSKDKTKNESCLIWPNIWNDKSFSREWIGAEGLKK